MAKHKYATVEQLRRAGIFNTAYEKCRNRLTILCQHKFVRSFPLPTGQLYYVLTPKGGLIVGVADSHWRRRYRTAPTMVMHRLFLTDFALAMGVDYMRRSEVFARLGDASYDALEAIARSRDVFFEREGRLHILVVDYFLSEKYIRARIQSYEDLPASVRHQIQVVVVVFSETRVKQLARLVGDQKIIKANWKYGFKP